MALFWAKSDLSCVRFWKGAALTKPDLFTTSVRSRLSETSGERFATGSELTSSQERLLKPARGWRLVTGFSLRRKVDRFERLDSDDMSEKELSPRSRVERFRAVLRPVRFVMPRQAALSEESARMLVELMGAPLVCPRAASMAAIKAGSVSCARHGEASTA